MMKSREPAYIAASRATGAGDSLQGSQRIADHLKGRPGQRQHGTEDRHAIHRQEVRRIPGKNTPFGFRHCRSGLPLCTV